MKYVACDGNDSRKLYQKRIVVEFDGMNKYGFPTRLTVREKNPTHKPNVEMLFKTKAMWKI